MNDNDTPFFPSNQPEWRLLAAAGALVVCLTAVWLPFGIIGFASIYYNLQENYLNSYYLLKFVDLGLIDL